MTYMHHMYDKKYDVKFAEMAPKMMVMRRKYR